MPQDSGVRPLRMFEQLMLSECMKSSISLLSCSSSQEPILPSDAVWLRANSNCWYYSSSLLLWQLGSEDDTFWCRSRVWRLFGDLKKNLTWSYLACVVLWWFWFVVFFFFWVPVHASACGRWMYVRYTYNFRQQDTQSYAALLTLTFFCSWMCVFLSLA